MEKIELACFLRQGMTEQERLERIRSLYKGYGRNFFHLCQVQEGIDEGLKAKLSEKVCTEYVRQLIYPTLMQHFSSGEIRLGELDKNNAKRFADKVASFDDKEYQELLEQIDRFEAHFDRQIEKADDGKGGK